MPTDVHINLRRIAGKISEFLEKGLPVNEGALHFIESTFSISTPQEVKAIFMDPGHDDRETLMNVLLFPDESMQIALEPFWENVHFTRKDVDMLINEVDSLSPVGRFVFPENRGTVNFPLTLTEIKQFTLRLNLLKTPDPKLVGALGNLGDTLRYYHIRVKLRNARMQFTQERIKWLELFFSRILTESNADLRLLDFALAFLGQVPDGADIFHELMHLKRSLLMAIDRYHQFLKQLKKDNMETLMLRGIRTPPLNKEEAVNKITCIDDICIKIYGKTAPAPLPVVHQDLGKFTQGEDLKRIIRALS